jgi:hypothetical protein
MAGVTAVELATEACLLSHASDQRGAIRVQDVEVVDRAALATADAFAAALKRLRQSRRFPSRARVVMWEMPAGSRLSDPAVRERLQPIRSAGFRIDRVFDPCEALTLLAKGRAVAPPATTGWAAINRTAVAIVVVGSSSASGRPESVEGRGAEVLYSRRFTWDSSLGAVGSQARLLQRYSLVASLAPELRRAMSTVASSHGARVDAIVTCGNLPDLRSLSMPLIEELDLEVETLDSLDGLETPAAIRDRVAELAPAIRLATAAMAPSEGGARPTAALAAAAVVLLAAGGIYLYAQQRAAHTPPAAKAPAPAPRSVATVQRTQAPATSPPRTPQPPSSTTPAPSSSKTPPSQTVASSAPAKAPVVPPSVPTAGAVPSKNPPSRPPARSPKSESPSPPAKSEPGAREKPHAITQPSTAPVEPLTDPVPIINTILVSPERRLAILNGRVVTVGDAVGPRVVAAIEPREVILQEPSGVQIRVGLGGRVLGIVRPTSR